MHEAQRDKILHPDPAAQRVLQTVLVPAVFGEESARTVFAVGLLFDRADPGGDARFVPARAVILQLDLAEAAFREIKERALQSLLHNALDDEHVAVAGHFFLHDLRLGFAHDLFDALDGFAPLHAEGRFDLLLGAQSLGREDDGDSREEKSFLHHAEIRVARGARQAQVCSSGNFS